MVCKRCFKLEFFWRTQGDSHERDEIAESKMTPSRAKGAIGARRKPTAIPSILTAHGNMSSKLFFVKVMGKEDDMAHTEMEIADLTDPDPEGDGDPDGQGSHMDTLE